QLGAMHWIAELLRRRSIGIVCAEIGVLRLVAVGAPMPLVLAGLGVVHDDAMISIPISDVHFIRVLIDENLRRPPEVFDVVAAFARADLADLHQEFSILSELHDHAVVSVRNTRDLTFIRCCPTSRLSTACRCSTSSRAGRSCSARGSRGRAGA